MRLGLFALALAVFAFPACAADDAALMRMALCRDSWAEWSKAGPVQFEAFRAHFMGAFSRRGDDAFFTAKTRTEVMGLPVLQAFPQSVGMGVGFSLTVDATFDDARKAAERALGRTLGKCESGEGMRSCELGIGPQRTFMVLADDKPKSHRALIGCYYF